LAERHRTCGKPSCDCARKGFPGHRPSDSVTHPVQGKTVTRIIPAGPAVEWARHRIAEYQRFRALVRELVAVSEQLCDPPLRPAKDEAPEDAKKIPSPILWPLTSFMKRQACWSAKPSRISAWKRWKWRFGSGFCPWPEASWNAG
jgi:hypothetical protein